MPQHAKDYWRREQPGLFAAETTDGRRCWLELHESRLGEQHNTWLLLAPDGRWLALDTPYRDQAFAAANRALDGVTLVRQHARPERPD